jgi:hypothetical protein
MIQNLRCLEYLRVFDPVFVIMKVVVIIIQEMLCTAVFTCVCVKFMSRCVNRRSTAISTMKSCSRYSALAEKGVSRCSNGKSEQMQSPTQRRNNTHNAASTLQYLSAMRTFFLKSQLVNLCATITRYCFIVPLPPLIVNSSLFFLAFRCITFLFMRTRSSWMMLCLCTNTGFAE